MKTDAFPKRLESFLREFLPSQRNASPHTIQDYGYAFALWIDFLNTAMNVPPDKVGFDHFTADIVARYLDWLEAERGNSIETRNHRLAAIRSFARYVQRRHPERIDQCQMIRAMRAKKGPKDSIVRYLTQEQISALLAGPDMTRRSGRRDATLLSLLYDSGIRAEELCLLTPERLRLEDPCHISVMGKGRKRRPVPLTRGTAALLRQYMEENALNDEAKRGSPLFFNQQRQRLTRGGVRYILRKYLPQLPAGDRGERISPHTLRHSKAMHLLQTGNPLVAIQSILGHAKIETTLRYAYADPEMIRRAMEKTPGHTPATEKIPRWREPETFAWLRNLCKKE